MIASLTGSVAHLGASTAIVDVNGVGYLVHLTPRHALELRGGEPVTLTTELVVREDAMTLYGFRSQDERSVFGLLTGVPGVGPKLALSVLSLLSPDELARALQAEDEKAFKSVPGVGPKTAKLIIVQLKGKLLPSAPGPADAVPAAPTPVLDDDVIEALVGLGTPQKQAAAVVAQARAELGDTPADVPTLLRTALRLLGASR